jgi:hypothetical protein
MPLISTPSLYILSPIQAHFQYPSAICMRDGLKFRNSTFWKKFSSKVQEFTAGKNCKFMDVDDVGKIKVGIGVSN